MDRARLKETLKRHEGFRAEPYNCSAGKLTIGYGRNLTDRGISMAEAERLLDQDILESIETAKDVCRDFERLTPARQEVLVNMAFNLGESRLRGFRKMLAAIYRQDWKSAAVEMADSRWYGQVGNRAVELCYAMQTGEWP